MWSFTIVRAPMRHQMAFAHEVFLTQITPKIRITKIDQSDKTWFTLPKWPLCGRAFIVRSLVEKEVTFEGERFAAFVACERPLTSVRPHMVHEMFLTSERFRTNVTTVRSFACMLTQMVG